MKRRQGQPTITSFFKKPKAYNLDDAANVDKNFPNNSECNEQSNLSFKVNLGPKTNFRVEGIDEENGDNISHLDSDDNISDPVTSTGFQEIVHPVWQANRFDIGNTNINSLDNTTKKNVLSTKLLPKEPYKYPTEKSHNRSFQPKWITNDFAWLAYSASEDSVYCKPCWLFFHEGVGKGVHQNPGKLVSVGFRDWKKAKESFKKHMEKEYHKVCVLQATSFLKISGGKQLDIASQLDSQRTKEIAENRAAIEPIIRTILFCAEQELPLRGDHDSGALSLTRPEKKDGKFRALLWFRIESGDKNLEKHVLSSSKNATYMSPIIQNEVIQTCSDIVTEKVIDRISNAECFSLLGDETMDVSGTEQLSLCIRYVDIPDLQAPVLREDFVGFIPINDQSSKNLANVILQRCYELNLDMTKCVGQGYDGAANMAGHLSGVQTRIRENYPKARYIHCASHRLNLTLSNVMSVPAIRNCLGVVSQVVNLFRNHSNANKIFQETIQEHAPDRKKRLLRLCDTRFIERHDSIIVFLELFECIVMALEEMAQRTWTISSTASTLHSASQKSEFLVSIVVCEKLFSLTFLLSIFLQNKSSDLVSAVKVTSRQKSSANPQTTSNEEYFRVTTFIPCIDTLIQNLTDRFIKNEDILSSFQLLLPRYACEKKINELEKLGPYFQDEMPLSAVQAEYKLWCAKISSIDPSTEILKLLEYCDGTFFRVMNLLLKVMATLPVTTASVERLFSTMKEDKNSTS
ncbi:repressor of the inhibitor of the protein kinase [Trichonephila clavata]|uniref:Repressor of the inhibitor of the protein kinase n=1 Tax=Trichonephila clavata TaxID=2740835 RepID=A0A8X6FQ77_TRICU|nr:repressor of the inhibitor of the protein kinase [Trichonephila clavata]